MANDLNIKDIFTELDTLNKEVSTRLKALNDLKKRKKELEKKVSLYLKEKGQPGIKYQGVAIVSEKVKRTVTKKKDDAKQEALTILAHYNIGGTNAEKIYNELLASKKEEVQKEIIKFRKQV